jgi:hypothetical protein
VRALPSPSTEASPGDHRGPAGGRPLEPSWEVVEAEGLVSASLPSAGWIFVASLGGALLAGFGFWVAVLFVADGIRVVLTGKGRRP